MMWKVILVAAALVGISLLALVSYGSLRWTEATRRLRKGLSSTRKAGTSQTIDFRELDGLPAPVRRYLTRVLVDGAPLIKEVRVRHEGEFNLSETGARWRPFSSDQLVTIQPPGFDWDARIKIIPGLEVRVHDAYVGGEGILQAAVLGLFPLVNQRGTREIAEGELMRFLAESAWYPTALLPSQGTRWKAVDTRSARAALTDGGVSVELLFRFNEQDLIESVEAEARGRMVSNQVTPTAWGGRYWGYERRAGMLVPLHGEVAWLLPEGAKPYWRGRIIAIEYRTGE